MEQNKNLFSDFKNVYFIGIGGIGMSALARYFNNLGFKVAGYDKCASDLTNKLEAEGCLIHYEDLGEEIPNEFKNKTITFVVFTPAIPEDMKELFYFISNEFTVYKRAEVLGILTRQSKGLCVAGTHGKTTTSSMLAYILDHSSWKCNAFLGGIATNFNSNLVLSETSDWTVVEADEFDRSFLKLSPFSSVVTGVDPDHLDIYGSIEQFNEGFRQYAMKIDPSGFLVEKEGLNLPTLAKKVSYALHSETADFSMKNLVFRDGFIFSDVRLKTNFWQNVKLGIPGSHNAENALACIALLDCLGMSELEIRNGLSSFTGVKRRFDYQIRTDDLVFIDDYAHHPNELKVLIESIRNLYPNKKITGIFQPHLFSRTRDFAMEFAAELSKLDELILLPIYPAREEPIYGISSAWLYSKVELSKKYLLTPSEALQYFNQFNKGIVLTIGAGDIDKMVAPLKEILSSNLTTAE
jgi:UDP-N-acetylmuramate--alanine ligase